jgi:hypothetical protein
MPRGQGVRRPDKVPDEAAAVHGLGVSLR